MLKAQLKDCKLCFQALVDCIERHGGFRSVPNAGRLLCATVSSIPSVSLSFVTGLRLLLDLIHRSPVLCSVATKSLPWNQSTLISQYIAIASSTAP